MDTTICLCEPHLSVKVVRRNTQRLAVRRDGIRKLRVPRIAITLLYECPSLFGVGLSPHSVANTQHKERGASYRALSKHPRSIAFANCPLLAPSYTLALVEVSLDSCPA